MPSKNNLPIHPGMKLTIPPVGFVLLSKPVPFPAVAAAAPTISSSAAEKKSPTPANRPADFGLSLFGK